MDLELDRKRKAEEEQLEENPSKRPLFNDIIFKVENVESTVAESDENPVNENPVDEIKAEDEQIVQENEQETTLEKENDFDISKYEIPLSNDFDISKYEIPLSNDDIDISTSAETPVVKAEPSPLANTESSSVKIEPAYSTATETSSTGIEVAQSATTETSVKSETTPLTTIVPFDRLVLLHLEATCDENPSNPASVQVTKENSEIIELTFVVVNASNMEILHKQQIYVKPERTPFTHFCSEITGIKWPMLEEAGTLNDAIATFDDYIQNEIEAKKKSFCFVTHGGWALRIQLPREARDKNLVLPNYLAYCRMFDLKQEIQRWQVHHAETSLRSTSLRDLCDSFNLSRVNNHTIGLNNALTILEIMKYLLGFHHKDVFVHPIDTMADLKQFKKEESQVIHLAGLPYEVTQGELEAWFSSNGLRPTTMWMIQPSDSSKPSISGFVVFQQHDDAMRALNLNGRCLGDRSIEVSPSSSRVIDAAGNMLVPFPLQPKSRHARPGDWNCTSCNFHNFASRLYCFKCNGENPNPSPSAGQGPPIQPVYHGDWMCTNCNFHNYSSRMQCKKCASPKPTKHFKGNKKLINVPPTSQQRPPVSHSTPRPPPPSSSSTPSTTGYHGHPRHSSAPHSGSGSGGYHGGYNSGGSHSSHPPISFRPGDWYCPNSACGFQNFASRHSCFRCHTPNPNQKQQAPPPAQYSPHQPGYGYSAESSHYSSSYTGSSVGGGVGGGVGNSSSSGYGYDQPGGGYGSSNYGPPGGGYAGSGGSGYTYGATGGGGYSSGVHQSGSSGGTNGTFNTQFRAGDWICPSCNSHNFASRFQCLKCGTSKPYKPTGGGSGGHSGGYNPNGPPVKRMFNNNY